MQALPSGDGGGQNPGGAGVGGRCTRSRVVSPSRVSRALFHPQFCCFLHLVLSLPVFRALSCHLAVSGKRETCTVKVDKAGVFGVGWGLLRSEATCARGPRGRSGSGLDVGPSRMTGAAGQRSLPRRGVGTETARGPGFVHVQFPEAREAATFSVLTCASSSIVVACAF